MGKTFLISLFCVYLGSLAAAEVLVGVSPQPVIVGETARISFSYAGNSYPRVERFPEVEGVTWLGESGQRTEIINGRITAESAYGFRVNREGEIKIPAIEVKVSGQNALTEPITITAFNRRFTVKGEDSDQTAMESEDVLFARVNLLTAPDKPYFVGEEIPIEIQVFVVNGLNVTLSWPELNLERAVFRNFSSNRENPRFAGYRKGTERLRGQTFNVYTFVTAFRPIAMGPLEGEVVVNCELRIQPQVDRRGSRSIFDGFMFGDPFTNYQRVQRSLAASLPKVSFEPLPPPPENTQYLGLVGEWRVETSLSAETPKLGEPTTLSMDISGVGTLDTLRAPEVEIDGARVYPPEVDKSPGNLGESSTARIKYAVIPLREGKMSVALNPVAFSPKELAYVGEPFHREFVVEKGELLPGATYQPPSVVDAAPTIPREEEARAPRRPGGILYLKTASGTPVMLPLWRNNVAASATLLIAGPSIFLLALLIRRRRSVLRENPAIARRQGAMRRREQVLRKLTAATPEEITDVGRTEVVPYLNDLFGESPGTSAEELAEKVADGELAECLNELTNSSYMPGDTYMGKARLKEKFLSAVKRAAVFLVAATVLTASAGAEVVLGTARPMTDAEARSAYDAGEFQVASDYYRERVDPLSPDPAMLYNLGNCLFQLGDLPRALVCYERALRLSPLDSDILENLNHTRERLGLPQRRQAETPGELLVTLRDSLRPDQWLLAAAIAWALGFAALACKGSKRLPYWRPAPWICIAALAVALIAWHTQEHDSYSDKNAIVIEAAAPVYPLPRSDGGKTIFQLRGGEPVTIEEFRGEWLRIRSDAAEGWVTTNSVSPLWIPDTQHM